MAGRSLLPPPEGARIVTSHVKAGRTWLRFMLAIYLADLFDLGGPVDLHSMFRIVPNNDDDPLRGRHLFAHAGRPDVPLILFEHKLFEPFDPRRNPTVVIVRAPVDTLVSAYFMATRRIGKEPLTLGEFIRSEKGLPLWARYHNALASDRGGPEVTWISYEGLTADPVASFGRVLDGFGIPRHPRRVEAAVQAARFDRMSALEDAQGFPGRTGDLADPQGRRMREGKVGAAGGYLDAPDRAWVAAALPSLLTPDTRARLATLGCAV